MSLRRIPIDRITIPEARARSKWTDEQLSFLRASIGRYGILQFPIVRQVSPDSFELIDGESRLKAAREQGLSEIDCYIVDMSPKDAAITNLLMNVARGEQDPMGMAVALKNASDAGMSIEEMAKAVNRSEGWVRFMISLLDLPEIYQEALRDGKLNVSHIREALRLRDPVEIDAALRSAIRLEWTASTLKNYVDNRIDQLEKHAQMVKATGIMAPPPAPEPESLVRYSQCLVCGKMVMKESILLPSTCSDCYNLARYIVTQIGTGQEAMNYIYQAVNHYIAFLTYQQQMFAQQQMAQTGFRPPTPPGEKRPQTP